MKCTWPTQTFCVGDPKQPIFHWLALGVAVGGDTIFRFGIEKNANFYVLDTNMLVYPMQNCARTQNKWFCGAVEYKLKGLKWCIEL